MEPGVEHPMKSGSPESRSSGNAELHIRDRSYRYFRVSDIDERLAKLPVSLRILAENVLRTAPQQVGAFLSWLEDGGKTGAEIEFRPARVLMHDTTCVPALVDIATLRDAVAARGGD